MFHSTCEICHSYSIALYCLGPNKVHIILYLWLHTSVQTLINQSGVSQCWKGPSNDYIKYGMQGLKLNTSNAI